MDSTAKPEGRRASSRSRAGLSLRQRRGLYLTLAGLWITGAVWLCFQYLWPAETPSEIQPLCLKIHGALAMIFLLGLGALLLQHVPAGWRERQQRSSGVFVLSICGVLVVTGWGLYYLGNETGRQWTSWIHCALGGVLPLVLVVHVVLAARQKAARSTRVIR